MQKEFFTLKCWLVSCRWFWFFLLSHQYFCAVFRSDGQPSRHRYWNWGTLLTASRWGSNVLLLVQRRRRAQSSTINNPHCAFPKVLTYNKLICPSHFAVIAVTKTEVWCGLKQWTASIIVLLLWVVLHRFQFYWFLQSLLWRNGVGGGGGARRWGSSRHTPSCCCAHHSSPDLPSRGKKLKMLRNFYEKFFWSDNVLTKSSNLWLNSQEKMKFWWKFYQKIQSINNLSRTF